MSELSISEPHGPHSLLSKGDSLNVEHSTGLSTGIVLMHRDGAQSRRRNILKLAPRQESWMEQLDEAPSLDDDDHHADSLEDKYKVTIPLSNDRYNNLFDESI